MLLGTAAAVVGTAIDSHDAQAADARIRRLEGFRNDDVTEAVLAVQNRSIEKLVIEYLTAFERARPASQEAMNAHAKLVEIQSRIEVAMASPAFKQALVTALRPKLKRGEQFEFEKFGLGIDTIDSRVHFYYSAKGNLGFGIDVNGLWATGG